MAQIKTVAVIGLGTMGMGMVRNLLEAGFLVVGWNRTRSRAQGLIEAGMAWADTPRRASAGAQAVILCVSDDAAVEHVALDPEIGCCLELATDALVLDCGTTSQSMTRRVADAVEARGGRFLDAPITGSKLGAERGALTFMVGGDPRAAAVARPLFEAMGKYVVHVGDRVGLGQAAKYCLNMSQAIVLEGVLEGYALGRRMGVPVEKLAEIFEHSAGKTGVGSFKTPYLLRGDFEPHFRLDLMHKDLHLALAEASRTQMPLPAARAVLTLYDQGVAEGLGPEDFLALARLLERWGKISLRGEGMDA